MWDSGEEQGLWGTRQFVATPPVPLEKIVAMFNIDMIGANRAPGSPDAAEERVTGPNEVFLIGPGVLSDRVSALIDRVNDEYLKLALNRRYDTPESEFFYPRTDAGPYLERGVLTIGSPPAFTIGITCRLTKRDSSTRGKWRRLRRRSSPLPMRWRRPMSVRPSRSPSLRPY